MKYLKLFEQLDETLEPIDLIGYPSGSIITVIEHEKNLLEEEGFEIQWDDEVDYEEGSFGQWRYLDEEEDRIEDFLEKIRDPLKYNIKKFNI